MGITLRTISREVTNIGGGEFSSVGLTVYGSGPYLDRYRSRLGNSVVVRLKAVQKNSTAMVCGSSLIQWRQRKEVTPSLFAVSGENYGEKAVGIKMYCKVV